MGAFMSPTSIRQTSRGNAMLSRVAENLYWLGRYVERVETLVRLLELALQLELDSSWQDEERERPLTRILDILSCRLDFERNDASSITGDAGSKALLKWFVLDAENPHAIISMVRWARENARGTQEALSSEAWNHINRLHLMLRHPKMAKLLRVAPTRFLDHVRRGCILVSGTIDASLPRDEVFHFVQLGRHIERVSLTSRIIRSTLHKPGEVGEIAMAKGGKLEELITGEWFQTSKWSGLLHAASAHEAYLRRYRTEIEPVSVLHFLILEPAFPRSLNFAVSRAMTALRGVGDSAGSSDYPTEAERALGRLEGDLRFLDCVEILESGLDKFLGSVLDSTAKVGEFVSQAYFMT